MTMIIPEGGIYLSEDKEYKEGENFPDLIQDGDVYIYKDYEYKYNFKATLLLTHKWLHNEEQSGWGVRVIDKKKTEYTPILESIKEKPVTSIRNTFYDCDNLILAPAIPRFVVDMFGAFSGCIKLQEMPNIPETVRNAAWAFEYCETLIKIKNLPEKIENISGMFADCSNIKEIPNDLHMANKNVFLNCNINRGGMLC